MNNNEMLWDNLLNKILDNYTGYKWCTIGKPLRTLDAIKFFYNNKIYTVVYNSYSTLCRKKEKPCSLYNFLYSITDNDGNETFVESRNILPLTKPTKKRFSKVLTELKTLQEKQYNAKIDKENQEIYQ